MDEFDFQVYKLQWALHSASQPYSLSLQSSLSFTLRWLFHVSLLEPSATPPPSDSQLMTSHTMSWEEIENQRGLPYLAASKSIDFGHITYPPSFKDVSHFPPTRLVALLTFPHSFAIPRPSPTPIPASPLSIHASLHSRPVSGPTRHAVCINL